MKRIFAAFLIVLTSLNVAWGQTPSAATSTVSVSPPVIPTGGTTTITVQLKEANGTNITSGAASVGFVAPSSGSIGTVTNNQNGTYTAIYTAGTTTGNVSIIPVVNSTNFSNTAQVTVGSSYILDGTSGNNTEIHSFSTNGNISIGQGFFVDYLIVGGGGGGGGVNGGGGGAGGFLAGRANVTQNNHSVTVGGGGTGGFGFSPSTPQHGAKGGNSAAFGLTASGGGGGATYQSNNTTEGPGGSGGGGSATSNTTGYSASAGQGFNGGAGINRSGSTPPSFAVEGGGGGGGAGGPGLPATQTNAHGGPGKASTITGSNIFYAGGGGGGFDTRGANRSGTGGTGGGGNGTYGSNTAGNGTNGLGGGGGGGGYSSGTTIQLGGNGGSGVVIARYTGDLIANAGGTQSSFTGNGTIGENGLEYHVHSFSANGNFNLSGVDFNQRLGVVLNTAISGSGNLTYSGPGRLTLEANNTYSGSTSISAGTLQIGNGGTTGTFGTGTITNNATLVFNRSNAFTLGSGNAISGTGTVEQIGSGTLDLGGITSHSAGTWILRNGGISNGTLAGNFTLESGNVSAILGGSGNLTKNTGGTVTLSANNTYSGTTTVNAGTLIVNGTHSGSGAVTVNSGANLKGTGNLSGTTTINSGATVEGGNSIGTLGFDNLTLAGGGNYNWQIDDATGTAGTNWDQLNVNGTLNITATSSNKFKINVWTLLANGTNGALANFNPTESLYTWTIITAGSITGFSADKFQINTDPTNGTGGLISPYQVDGFTVLQQGNTIVLQYDPPAAQTIDGTNNGTETANYTTSNTVGSLTLDLGFFTDYLIVGGGGGGGGVNAGGGAGGGFLEGYKLVNPINHQVVVGQGGQGGFGFPNGANEHGSKGGNSSVFGQVAFGGGGGSSYSNHDNNKGFGGSGGGKSLNGLGFNGVSGQGYNGGAGITRTSPFTAEGGGGGGGAGGPGLSATQANSNGGPGRVSAISGTSLFYAGGGGGGFDTRGANRTGTGGTGGGGNGTYGSNTAGNGTNGLGGGGGGAGYSGISNSQLGGNGGSGVVIIRYQGDALSNVGGTVSSFTGNGTIGFNGVPYQVHTFTSSGNFNLSNVDFNARLKATLAGNIIGTGDLIYDSKGRLSLTGTANTYTGATTIQNGELAVNSDITSSSGVTVASTATLSGTGTLPATTINGTHNPGNSPGLQTINGNLTYNANAVLNWELATNSVGTRGTDFDAINVSGNLDFAGATTLNLIFDGSGSAVDWSDNFWDNPSLGTNGWKIFEVSGTISNLNNLSINVVNWVDGQNTALAAARAGYTITFDLHQDGSDIYLTYNIQAQNADLSNLVMNPNGPLSPAFNSATLNYTNPVSSATTSVDVTATLDDTNASMTINGQAATSGSATTINLGGGQNIITIEVTAADGITAKTYTVDVSVPVDATETVVSFKNTGTTSWIAPPGVHKVQVLVVGGGGGGAGRDIGGGGGAGGLVFNPDFSVTPGTSYTVTVGAGGAGGVDPSTSDRNGKRGGNSVFGSITAQGGGGGKGWSSTNNTNNGGSGGGGSGGTDLTAGTGTSGQGTNGGNGAASTTSDYGGGGGGGAGQTGFASSASTRGKGGDGLSAVTIGSVTYNFMNLFGTTHGGQASSGNLFFAGGGGGAGHRNSGPMHSGPGGLGGGGAVPGTTGSNFPSGNGGAGLANTGGGGGASRNENRSGGAGGSGVVIIRYSVLEVGQNGPDQVIADTETSGFIGLNKVDSNTVEMTGNSNFSGISVTGGTLLLGDNGTSGDFGNVNPRVDANTFFGINRSDDITYNHLIIGQGGFVHRGDGKTTFTQRQTYTGGTFVDNGTLIVAGGTPSGGTGGIVGDVTVNEGASLEYADIRSFGYGNGESVTSLTINGGSVGNNFYNYFWNASSTFPINLNGGTLVLGGAAIGATANQFLSPIITVGAGSPSQINRADGNTTANLRLRDGSHLTVNTVAGSKLFINVPVTSMSGATDGAANGQLIKNGTGTLVLNSTNLYTGATTINEGTLEVNGSINSAITMSSSGIIAGNGTLSSVSLRGTVSPGSDGTGTLTTGNITLAGNTAYVLDLDNADDVNGVPGTDWDLLQVNGTLALGSHEIIIELQGSPGDFSFLQEYSWKILSANSITGFNANNWTVNTIGFSAFTGNALWTVEQVGNDIFLKFEPKSIVWPGVGELNNVDLTEVNDNFTIDAGKTLIVEIGAPIDYLVVGGGGSGAGRDVGGGGGGGGVLSNLTQPNPSFIYLAAGTYNVSVGAGGPGTNNNDGVNGQNSVFGPFTAIGGGGGGFFASYTAPLGGSGGGGGRQGYFGGPGVNGQGFAGGNGSNGNTALYDAGGGGGGAGGIGQTAIKGTASTQGKGGDGGPGVQINFTGIPTYFGGGGGGAPHRSSSLTTMISGLGGIGGGGNAAVNSSSPPQAGQPNTGGGGGASRSVTGNLIIGGNGGSGIVQVRYPAPAFASGGTTLAGTGSANGFTIHSFTQNGAATFTIPEDGLKTTYLGLLEGPGNFEFDSPGTLVIANNQSYTGTSKISQGNMEVNANITSSSSLVVTSTAILSGTGTLPATEVFGTHNPGAAVGVQTVNGNLTYKSGSVMNWELFANSVNSRGTNFDGVDISGDLVFEANTSLNINFDAIGSVVDWNDPFWNISRYEIDGWKLFSVSGTVSGLNNVTLPTANLLDANGVNLSTVYPNIIGFELKQVGNDVYLSFVSSTVWYGANNDQWNTNTNWLSNRLPVAGEGLIIDAQAIDHLVLDQSYVVADIKFAGAGKNIILENHDLTFTGMIYGADANNYIQTNGTGKLKSNIAANNNVRFEVGRSAYNPVEIQASVADTFAVFVKDTVENNTNLHLAIYVNRTWEITKADSAANNTVNFNYHWNIGEVVNGPMTAPILNHYNGNNWENANGINTPGAGNPILSLTHTIYTGAFSPFAISDASTPLPVEFLGMQYECLDKNGVELNWQTASEMNAKYFELMRSEDGFNWEKVGQVDASGTTSSLSEYNFVDNTPSRNALRYYQLKQVDFNGDHEWLPIISVNCEVDNAIRLYPNPTSDKAFLSIPSDDVQNIHIQLMDQTGRIIDHWEHKLSPGNNILEIDVKPLQNGVYTILYSNNNKQQPLKMIINK